MPYREKLLRSRNLVLGVMTEESRELIPALSSQGLLPCAALSRPAAHSDRNLRRLTTNNPVDPHMMHVIRP